MTDDDFKILKEACIRACHARHACADGYRQMLASKNVSQMMATWRDNWEDIVESKYADIIRTELPKQYPALKEEMNRAGIYLNECPEDARQFVRVLVTDTDTPVKIHCDAQAYVLGTAKVLAFGHSQVYNERQPDAHIMLYDRAYGKAMAGRATAYDRSRLVCCCNAHIADAVECDAYGGTVRAQSFLSIRAYRDTIVYSDTDKRIALNGDAQLKPLTDYEQ